VGDLFANIFGLVPVVWSSIVLTVSRTTGSWLSSAQRAATLPTWREDLGVLVEVLLHSVSCQVVVVKVALGARA
jgi:hypothetical protein